MKYLIIIFIALGLTFSLIFGIEYSCTGQEMFPIYYGSPFVFKQKSLGSSMEYYYSISGLLLNVIIWSSVILIIRYGINKLIKRTLNNKIVIIIYKISVGLLIIFSLANTSIAYLGMGRGFDKNLNYWYWNFNKEAKDWGMTCEGEWKVCIK
jgi:hypothetical protein